MWRAVSQRGSMACSTRIPRTNIVTPISAQVRTMVDQTEKAFKKPAALDKPAPVSQKHDPQPTESEVDVAADRSRIDPIHRQNPTESQEDIMADPVYLIKSSSNMTDSGGFIKVPTPEEEERMRKAAEDSQRRREEARKKREMEEAMKKAEEESQNRRRRGGGSAA
ncbi:hypothetical protein NM208_g404 [Fusarium decemcellulare]|uniref:Uncharacterized protein n=1 Tax=Fusarium decemcellulare TaxID=57161 RepID=A0ACC1SZR6_9HYPO|nr:hypothetical protein NM208_g404 [Fusarium decemcellulare]